MLKKQVSFKQNNETFVTYSSEEYDRFPIDSVLYRKSYNRISNEEWRSIFINLDLYKLYEMRVHKDSLNNNSYSLKKINFGLKL
jgi:hypothetical protein